MQVSIDEDTCVGAGQCVLAAPEVFDQRDEDGIAYTLSERPELRHHSAIEEAAQICPSAAIRVET